MGLDVFEVVMLVGACFLVNYITADSKTNWAEGYTLISFYLIIVSALWSSQRSS
jgi:Ca2+:H+ antiporter